MDFLAIYVEHLEGDIGGVSDLHEQLILDRIRENLQPARFPCVIIDSNYQTVQRVVLKEGPHLIVRIHELGNGITEWGCRSTRPGMSAILCNEHLLFNKALTIVRSDMGVFDSIDERIPLGQPIVQIGPHTPHRIDRRIVMIGHPTANAAIIDIT